MSMSSTPKHRPGRRIADRAWQVITAVSMTAGRGPLARAVAGAAELTPVDRVVDIGCGPGTAVRYAARRAAAATGIDPDPAMLRLARWSTVLRPAANITWLQGRAEKLPLPDGQATVAWAISSAHHWEDRGAAITEARRVLTPGGRLVLAERLAEPGARGHAAHGLTRDQADDLARQLTAAGFRQVRPHTAGAGRRTLSSSAARKTPQPEPGEGRAGTVPLRLRGQAAWSARRPGQPPRRPSRALPAKSRFLPVPVRRRWCPGEGQCHSPPAHRAPSLHGCPSQYFCDRTINSSSTEVKGKGLGVLAGRCRGTEGRW